MARILFLEMNEIPYRLIDHYMTLHENTGRYPNLAWFFKSSWQLETYAVDKGELSPWITWPTIHRGMSADHHHVYYLGQDVKSFRGTPVWEDIRRAGGTVGVFGPLQSWPPQDPGPHGFYVPDTFAHDEKCYPASLEPLQKFNLDQVRQSGRAVKGKLGSLSSAFQFLISAFQHGLTLKTFFRVAWQVVSERINPDKRAQRSCFQTVLFWDIFKNLYFQKSKHFSYASFFSNHVAGMMHRFWKDVFPQDFNEEKTGRFKFALDYSIDLLEDILTDVRQLTQDDPELVVLFGTSMGQKAIHREGHHGHELSVVSLQRLVDSMNLKDFAFTPLLAMVPQVALCATTSKDIQRFSEAVRNFKYRSGTAVFRCDVIDLSISLTIKTPDLSDVQAGVVYFGENMLTFNQTGIEVHNVDAGTAYHTPEGILAVFNSKLGAQPAALRRFRLSADQIKKFLLDLSVSEVSQLENQIMTMSYLKSRSVPAEVKI